jgi:enamine deaminase RidA (YjgF/YER057c/UK114 family)
MDGPIETIHLKGIMTSAHKLINPTTLSPPLGFSHAAIAAAGRTIYLGGQTAHGSTGLIQGTDLIQQFDVAAANVVTALKSVDAHPEDLVSMQIFVTDVDAYRGSTQELRDIYRKHFGRHYPAISLFEVVSLFDPEAFVELVCIAVVPENKPDYESLPLNGA